MKTQCKRLLKRMDGVLLNELETQDMFNFKDDEVWKKYPYPATAADFMKTNALTKHAGSRICIGVKNDRFIVLKNIDKSINNIVSGWEGSLLDLYELLEINKPLKPIKKKKHKPMEIAGKYKKRYIIMRCCDEGEWFITQPMYGSGCLSCEHSGSTIYYDYLDVSKLKDVTDEKILEDIKLTESYKFYVEYYEK
jgi:hypothetical protein